MVYELLTDKFMQDTAGSAHVLVEDLMRTCRLRTAWFEQVGILEHDDAGKLHQVCLLMAAFIITAANDLEWEKLFEELECRMAEEAFNPAVNENLH